MKQQYSFCRLLRENGVSLWNACWKNMGLYIYSETLMCWAWTWFPVTSPPCTYWGMLWSVNSFSSSTYFAICWRKISTFKAVARNTRFHRVLNCEFIYIYIFIHKLWLVGSRLDSCLACTPANIAEGSEVLNPFSSGIHFVVCSRKISSAFKALAKWKIPRRAEWCI